MTYGARLVLTAMVASAGLVGCSDNTNPTEEVAGSYAATTFVATPTGGSPQDVLAAEGSMTITLTGEGTTSGTVNIPASITGGDAILESMQGTFTRSGDTITFDQAADTFVRLAAWSFAANTISTTYTNSGGSIQVTLTRS